MDNLNATIRTITKMIINKNLIIKNILQAEILLYFLK